MNALALTLHKAGLSHLMGRTVVPDVIISGLTLDSRRVQAGDLFLALAGEVYDGRHFIEQAVANGAVAIAAEAPVHGFVDALPVPLLEVPGLLQDVGRIAARFYAEPSRHMQLVGVTGTNGKTTTVRLIAQLLRKLGRACGTIGTLGASLDERIVSARNTTPDAPGLQRQLADWRDQSVTHVAMEVSSHALVQGRVNGIHFDTAVFTNLSRDHLDYHGDMETYARAKMRLFACEGLGHALINADDGCADLLLAHARMCGCSDVLTYSLRSTDADIRVRGLTYSARGASGRIATPWGDGLFESPLSGDFNVSNLAAAIACIVLDGVPLADVLAVVPSLEAVPGRLQSVPNNLGIQVLVDYAHTPDALAQVLRAIRPSVSGSLITVFGCGGDRDPGKRAIMGRMACEGSDRVIVTSDNPRTENPRAIADNIAAGCTGDFELEVDRALAIGRAIAEAGEGDCVLIAGKGHEDYQIVEEQRLHFSDFEQAQMALAGRARR